jgi:hypothetical protein
MACTGAAKQCQLLIFLSTQNSSGMPYLEISQSKLFMATQALAYDAIPISDMSDLAQLPGLAGARLVKLNPR